MRMQQFYLSNILIHHTYHKLSIKIFEGKILMFVKKTNSNRYKIKMSDSHA